jgi:hypothetical protein
MAIVLVPISAPGATASVPGSQLWVARFSAGAQGVAMGVALAVSRDGTRTYVTGSTGTGPAPDDYLPSDFRTVAYNTATGARLWTRRYDVAYRDEAESIALAPGGGRVFVAGTSSPAPWTGGRGSTFTTVAYNASTGTRLWVRRYRVDAVHASVAQQLTVAPDGRSVFVTGWGAGRTNDYVTVAYAAATGAQRWVARYNGPGNGFDAAYAIAVGPAGRRVFVTGGSKGVTSRRDYATVAYRSTTGARLWVKRYNGPGNAWDSASSVVVGPGGGPVFVTGSSAGSGSKADYATIAYSAMTGARLWKRRLNGPANGDDYASSIAIDPTGSLVYVTGELFVAYVAPSAQYGWTDADYGTVAYNAVTGGRVWMTTFGSTVAAGSDAGAPATDIARSIAVNADGSVFVTGTAGAMGSDSCSGRYSRDGGGAITTIGYAATTGAMMWTAAFTAPPYGGHGSCARAVAASRTRAFVTGAQYTGGEGDFDYADAVTVAYSG